jgi:hypothetical protein
VSIGVVVLLTTEGVARTACMQGSYQIKVVVEVAVHNPLQLTAVCVQVIVYVPDYARLVLKRVSKVLAFVILTPT